MRPEMSLGTQTSKTRFCFNSLAEGKHVHFASELNIDAKGDHNALLIEAIASQIKSLGDNSPEHAQSIEDINAK